MKPTAGEPGPPTRNATQTRERIFNSAKALFSTRSYENVGTRDIAAEAGVTAALVNRYFGTKEQLFTEVLFGAFALEDHVCDELGELGRHLAEQALGRDAEKVDGSFDSLRVLLRAAGSPVAAALVAEHFHAQFVAPLARMLPGPDKDLRAGLVASYLIGLATMHHALSSPTLPDSASCKIVERVGAAMQACIDG